MSHAKLVFLITETARKTGYGVKPLHFCDFVRVAIESQYMIKDKLRHIKILKGLLKGSAQVARSVGKVRHESTKAQEWKLMDWL